jgi:hypothetical protein
LTDDLPDNTQEEVMDVEDEGEQPGEEVGLGVNTVLILPDSRDRGDTELKRY